LKITVEYRNNKIELEFEYSKVKAKDILKKLNLSRDYAFVVKNDEIVDLDEHITPSDKVKVINAISGGKFWENVTNVIKKHRFTFRSID